MILKDLLKSSSVVNLVLGLRVVLQLLQQRLESQLVLLVKELVLQRVFPGSESLVVLGVSILWGRCKSLPSG
jgi:hypothetical protein